MGTTQAVAVTSAHEPASVPAGSHPTSPIVRAIEAVNGHPMAHHDADTIILELARIAPAGLTLREIVWSTTGDDPERDFARLVVLLTRHDPAAAS